MKKYIEMKYLIILITSASLLSCKPSGTDDPMAELAKLKDEKTALEAKIDVLEKQLIASGDIEKKLRTVSLTAIKVEPFNHFIDLQGRVYADESVAVTSRMPGALTSVLVNNGDVVRRGQLMATLDDGVLQKNMAELEGQLKVATDLYNRQKTLWDQNIGSEVQFIQAKNNMESIQRSMSTLQESRNMARIYAPTSGTVDQVMLNPGQAIAPGVPLCNIVNLDKLKITGEVTESYAAKVKKGDKVVVYFPDTEKEITTTISYVSKTINVTNRTFTVEALLGKGDYRANQIAVMKIVDYTSPKAITIPVNLIQQGEDGDYVMIVEKSGTDNQAIVRKAIIRQGQNYNGYVEVLDGLKEGDLIINTGFQDVSNGETVAVSI